MIKIIAFFVFHFLRLSERVLPLSVLSFLLWPLAAVWDLLHLRQRTPLPCWRRFPEAWRLTNYQFSLSPPADVPMFLSTSEIGLSPRLSSIRKILGPTGRLGMLVDVDRGKQFYVPFENRLFRMATGP